MAIIYVVFLDSKRRVLAEAAVKKLGSKDVIKSHQQKEVLAHFEHFQFFQTAEIQLDSEFTLHYKQQGAWVCAMVADSDTSKYEAMCFFDAVCDSFQKEVGPAEINENHEAIQMRFSKPLEETVLKWNADPSKRDQAQVVFKNLLEQKESIQANLEQLYKRGEKVEDLEKKALLIQTESKTYKSNAKKTSAYFKRRRLLYWVAGFALFLVLVVIILIVLWSLHVI